MKKIIYFIPNIIVMIYIILFFPIMDLLYQNFQKIKNEGIIAFESEEISAPLFDIALIVILISIVLKIILAHKIKVSKKIKIIDTITLILLVSTAFALNIVFYIA